ncbi:MAG: phytoene desaturase family protein [Phycisphaerales bacterium]
MSAAASRPEGARAGGGAVGRGGAGGGGSGGGDRGGGGVSIGVVGAGPGGLGAAMLLAASGARVTVYEREPAVGGRTARITLGGAYHFDRGPTFFLMPYVLEEIFASTGRRLSDYATLKRLDPMYRLIVGKPGAADRAPGGGAGRDEGAWTIDATQDIAAMCRRIGAIHPRDGGAFDRFIRDNRAKLKAAEPILRRPIRSPLDLVRPDGVKAGLHIKPHLSVHGLLCKYFEHPAVRLAVSFQSKYLGMSPYDCPSLFTILPLIEYEYGIWHPIGGCNALMHAMSSVVEELGGEIRTGCPVEALSFEGRRATGVVVDGVRHAHDHVLINADATWALKKLVPDALRRRITGWQTERGIDERRYSCSTAMLYLGIDGRVDLPHHTIYVSSRYQENLAEISRDGGLSDDPSVYVCNPVVTDPSMAPHGKSALYVLMPTPNLRVGGVDWKGESARARTLMLEQLERRFGIRDIGSRIEHEMMLTPDDWAGMNINHGATFNLAHNLGQMLHKRPRHEATGLESLWFVGGGTHPGSGLPVIFLSSQIAARMICERAGLGLNLSPVGVEQGARWQPG